MVTRTLHIHPMQDGHLTDEVLVVSRWDGIIQRKKVMSRDAIFALVAHPAVRHHYSDIIHHADKLGRHLHAV